MGRQIKFRAWDKENKFMFKIFDSVTQEDWYLPQWKERHEVMQFTGLKDKNGKEIYEGDIVKYSYISPMDSKEKSYIWVVKYANGMYWLRHIGELKYYDSTLYLKFTQIEVIGNIYEHQELMEVSK